MRPKDRRKRVYQSISSAFSRMSSSRGGSPEIQSTPNPDTADGVSTPDSPTHYLNPRKKRQRMYQSFSSAFSKKASPRANSPEPTVTRKDNAPHVYVWHFILLKSNSSYYIIITHSRQSIISVKLFFM